jgi:thiamine-phosphate pyrophosphorylase
VIICLVTDRRRADPIAQAQHAVEAGIDLIQIRERDLEAAALATLTRAVAVIARGSATLVVVNDRVDVAIACGIDGVHLRADSVAADAVRRLVPNGFLVGRSIHAAAEAEEAGPVDYLVAGTAFPSASKADSAAWLGETGLRAIVQSVRTPVIAIGGIATENVDAVARAGAAGVAAIGLFAVDGPLVATVRALRSRFDRAKPHP